MLSNKPEKLLVNIIMVSILRQSLLHLQIYSELYENNTHHLLSFTLTP